MNQNAKNANVNMDSSLFINCNFDTDYLEVTKTESLRKYEENVRSLMLDNKFFYSMIHRNKNFYPEKASHLHLKIFKRKNYLFPFSKYSILLLNKIK